LDLINNLQQTIEFFITISLELILLFLGISFLVGLMLEYVPPEKIQKAMGGNSVFGNIIGAGFGAITPFCSCSTIPLVMGFLNAGVPFGSTVAFLVSSPLMNPIILGMVIAFMGWKIAIIYAIATFTIAVFSGWLWKRLGLEKEVKKVRVVGCHEEDLGEGRKYVKAAKFAWNTFKGMVPYLFLGVAVGALIYGMVPSDVIASLAGPENPLAIPVAAFIGIPLYVRAETIIPIGIALIGKGMSTGAVMALLIGGAGASIPELTMLAGIFKRKLVIAFVSTILLSAIMTGFLVEIFV